MKRLTYSFLILITIFLGSCKSSFTAQDRAQLVSLQEKLDTEAFEFKATAALPFNTQELNNVANDLLLRNGNSASRINVQGDHYTLQITGEEATFALPFYGERRMGGGYNNDNGYNFTTVIKDVTSTINDKNRYISYEFTTLNNNNETLNVQLQIYSLNSVNLNITSSHRTFMKYDGTLEWIEKGEE